jgi:hypothetical protein
VGCSGAGGARDCGCGVAEVADDGEQRVQRSCGDGAERRRSRGSKMRLCKEVKEVEEDSWMCCGTKKGHGRDGAAAGDRRHDMAGRGKASRVGRAVAG